MDVQEFAKRFIRECYLEGEHSSAVSWERIGDAVSKASCLNIQEHAKILNDLNDISPERPTLFDALRARCEQAIGELCSQRMYQSEQAKAEAFGEVLKWIGELEGKP